MSEDILHQIRITSRNHDVEMNEEKHNRALLLIEDMCYLMCDAPGGTGKTFLMSVVLATVRVRSNIAAAVASFGIAATLLEGCRTAHSALKLPLNLQTIEEPTCNITKNSAMAKVLSASKIIIWDECTMAHKRALEALNRTLKDLRNDSRCFGGAMILLSVRFPPNTASNSKIYGCRRNKRLPQIVQSMALCEETAADNKHESCIA
ncbi:unnamed protein product [Arctia plantaginis]|uniref:ATP-dependent DNA helicase n=1 Tax=Arctia plantaginis TaxID=874455 RepID=A0A8S0ZMC4_ARCPL|nr:unnamed protein product [Arctia plantaginis]